jgi:hypothetical protein
MRVDAMNGHVFELLFFIFGFQDGVLLVLGESVDFKRIEKKG